MTSACVVEPPSEVGVTEPAGAPEEVDIAIFGAGPAGLSAALALSKACPDLKVSKLSTSWECGIVSAASLDRTTPAHCNVQ